MSKSIKTGLLPLAAGFLLVATIGATAQTAEPPIVVTPECAPEAPDKPAHCDSLSGQLGETGGVIRPPETHDDGIHVPAPEPMPGTTPVIPPSALPDDPVTGGVDEGTAVPK